MIKFAKVINETTGLCEVGLGTNSVFYTSIGMKELEVSQSEINGQWYLTEKCPHYSETEQATQRETEFNNVFFEIPNKGYYRKQPKGYNSAVESMNTAFNTVSVLGKLPADTLTFYTAPDFTKEEQCRETWLIEHSYKNTEMTAEEFGTFYATFITAWNNGEHL